MKTRLKIKGGEYEVDVVHFRTRDVRHDRRTTVTIFTSLSYSQVTDLFSDPGEWSVVEQFGPVLNADGEVLHQRSDRVIDCTDYVRLLSIKDTRTGVLEVVMSKMTDSEILAELLEVLSV